MEEKAKRRATKKRVELTSKGGGQFQKGKRKAKVRKRRQMFHMFTIMIVGQFMTPFTASLHFSLLWTEILITEFTFFCFC